MFVAMKQCLCALLAVFLISCGSGLKTSRQNVRPISPSYSAMVNNDPQEVKHNRNGAAQSLLRLFEISDVVQSRVSVSFTNGSELQLTYMSRGQTKNVSFQGRFKRKGYYEVLLRNKRTEIPPLLPVFYSQVDVKRLRIALTADNNLLVDDTWQRTGNIFFLAGGASGRTQSVFTSSGAASAHP
jgi:hypothetical protein